MVQERILIVDGDITLSEVLKARLETMGCVVDCARSGSEALDVLETKWIDLIVLAIVLQGGMNGYKLFKEIKKRKRLSKIPIVVQTSKTAMKETFEMMGAETFLIKPYSVDLFLNEIKDILTKKVSGLER